MTEAQIWTMMGVFTAVFLGTMTTVSTLFIHVVKAEVRRLDDKFDAVNEKFDAVNEKFDAVNDKMDRRFDAVDRDLQALFRKVFGADGK